MHKFVIKSITDHQGVPKQEFFDEMNEKHPGLIGEILCYELLQPFGYLLFGWDDDSGKMLRTSRIEKVYGTFGGFKIVTKNSIYILERVREVGDNNE